RTRGDFQNSLRHKLIVVRRQALRVRADRHEPAADLVLSGARNGVQVDEARNDLPSRARVLLRMDGWEAEAQGCDAKNAAERTHGQSYTTRPRPVLSALRTFPWRRLVGFSKNSVELLRVRRDNLLRHPGRRSRHMTNHIAHFEIFATDVERARRFYERVFG